MAFWSWAALALFVLILLCNRVHVVNYNVKFLLYYLLVNLIALISLPLFIFRPKDVENYRYAENITKIQIQFNFVYYSFHTVHNVLYVMIIDRLPPRGFNT